MPTPVMEDNQGTIALMENPQFHWQSKHFNPKLHFICEKISDKELRIKYCKTSQMTADVLKKALSKPIHKAHIWSMGMASDWGGVLNIA